MRAAGVRRDVARRPAPVLLALLLPLALCVAVAGDGGGEHGGSATGAGHDNAPAQPAPPPQPPAPGGGDGDAPAADDHGGARDGAPAHMPAAGHHGPHEHAPPAVPVNAAGGDGPDRLFVIEEVNMNDHALVAYSVPEDQVVARTRARVAHARAHGGGYTAEETGAKARLKAP